MPGEMRQVLVGDGCGRDAEGSRAGAAEGALYDVAGHVGVGDEVPDVDDVAGHRGYLHG